MAVGKHNIYVFYLFSVNLFVFLVFVLLVNVLFCAHACQTTLIEPNYDLGFTLALPQHLSAQTTAGCLS